MRCDLGLQSVDQDLETNNKRTTKNKMHHVLKGQQELAGDIAKGGGCDSCSDTAF